MTDWERVVQLIDHRGVAWDQVRQTRFWMRQQFRYQYPGSIRELRQRLIVAPRDLYGDQQLCAFDLRVSAPDAQLTTQLDAFGNRVVLVYVPEVAGEVIFEMLLEVERRFDQPLPPPVTAAEAARYHVPTALTAADAAILAVAQRLAAEHPTPDALAAAINGWASAVLRYGWGMTNVATTAAEALRAGIGLCQDFAHLMLAVCRAAGLAARYVSGHMLGEGGSHAWVEVLLPAPDGSCRVLAYDPTNARQTTPGYITVAVGRDYADVSPTSGSFIAPYQGELTTSKRAGLIDIVYRA